MNFIKSNKSIISNDFYWFKIKSKYCNKCYHTSYDLINYDIMEIDIKGASQYFNNKQF